MSYQIDVAPSVLQPLRELNPLARRKVQAAIELLAEEPCPPAAERLVNAVGVWRVRVGICRLVYGIENGRLMILVLADAQRREVYRKP